MLLVSLYDRNLLTFLYRNKYWAHGCYWKKLVWILFVGKNLCGYCLLEKTCVDTVCWKKLVDPVCWKKTCVDIGSDLVNSQDKHLSCLKHACLN